MDQLKHSSAKGVIAGKLLCIAALAMISACDSPLTHEAKRAQREGDVISNDLMASMYPQTFRPGNPPYLERDYEAGANFICDKIEHEYHRDICAEPGIHWR